jgi:protein gp37
MAMRLQAMGMTRYANGFKTTLHPELLKAPFLWKRPRVVFVNSMSDLFHPAVPSSFIRRMFYVMNACPQHTFQVLTKRSERLRELDGVLTWGPNVWMGVSVEDGRVLHRIGDLVATRAQVKFLSCEPLIGPLNDLPLRGIDWVIVGGESGPRCRPMQEEWVRSIRDQCRAADVSFFFKQWGGVQKKRTGRMLDGRTWDCMPTLAHELPLAARRGALSV